MPIVQSRVNGLKINVPADAAGVVPRFATRGGNELVFEKPKTPVRVVKDEKMVVKSEAPDSDAGGLA